MELRHLRYFVAVAEAGSLKLAAMSLIESTHAVALLPTCARVFLPRTVTTRPLGGDTPKTDLSIGYRRVNDSPILKLFLSRVNRLKSDRE
jgi:LysR family transcriptional regulator, hca operon transcriptional activator